MYRENRDKQNVEATIAGRFTPKPNQQVFMSSSDRI